MYVLLSRLLHAGVRRHLALLTATFVFIVVVGAAAFSRTEGIGFLTALYWAITTATTVGYGDIIPHSGASQVVASIVMLTAIPTLGSLFALAAGASISAGIRRIMEQELKFPEEGFRLLVGDHPTHRAIVHELLRAGEPVAVVADIDPATLPDRVRLVRGDPTDPAVLRKANPQKAAHILVTTATDGDVLIAAVLLREMAPDVPMTALSSSGGIRSALSAIGVQENLSVDQLVSHTLAKSLETPHAGHLLIELIDSEEHTLVEIPAPTDMVGAALSTVRHTGEGLLLGLVRAGQVRLGIIDDPQVAAGDLLLIASRSKLSRVLES